MHGKEISKNKAKFFCKDKDCDGYALFGLLRSYASADLNVCAKLTKAQLHRHYCIKAKKVAARIKVVSVTANGLERMAIRIVERKAVTLFDTDK